MGRLIWLILFFCFVISPLGRADWRQLTISDNDIFYLSYDGALLSFGKEWVYRFRSGQWLKCCRLRGRKVGIYDVACYHNNCYWATTIGLFRCSCGEPSERIFLPPEKEVLAVWVGALGILVGTSEGIFSIDIHNNNRIAKVLSTDEVRDILVLPDKMWVFLLTKTSVYIYDYASKKIVLQRNIGGNVNWIGTGHRCCYDRNKGVLFAYASKVYQLDLNGFDMNVIFDYPGFLSAIACSNRGEIVVSGSAGLFIFDGGQWQKKEEGLLDKKVIDVISVGNRFYATDGRAVFVWSSAMNIDFSASNMPSAKLELVWKLLSWEPDIGLLQRKAMEYAYVSPEKIGQWQKRVKKSALLPKLTLDMDLDNNKSVSDSVAVSSTGAENVGPDDKSIYKAVNFGISLQWDLSELLWNSEEINIDTRAKLTVELRDDILDQLNQLYFERRRYQVELIIKPPKDMVVALKKLIKIDRLRADIDALTGGFLTNYLKENGHLGWERKFIEKLLVKDKDDGGGND